MNVLINVKVAIAKMLLLKNNICDHLVSNKYVRGYCHCQCLIEIAFEPNLRC